LEEKADKGKNLIFAFCQKVVTDEDGSKDSINNRLIIGTVCCMHVCLAL